MPLLPPENPSRHRQSFITELEQQIRMPMNTIIGLSSVEINKNTEPEQAETFQKINTAATDLMKSIDSLLSVSKLEAGRLQINQEIFDVESVIADACATGFPRNNETGNELVVNIDPRISSKLLGDGTQMWLILKKLLAFFSANTTQGEIYVTAARKSQTRENESLKFFIYSTVGPEREDATMRACGIRPDVSGQTKMESDIAEICQNTENNGGEIIFESAGPQELICVLVLPFARVADNIPSIGTFFAEKYLHFRDRRALLAVARETLSDNLVAILEIAGMRCRTANSTARALECLGAAVDGGETPDIIIADMDMPDFSPQSFTRFFTERRMAPVPCLAFAAPGKFEQYEQQLKDQGMALNEAGVTDSLEKPAGIRDVLSKLACFLHKTVNIGKEPFTVNLPEATTVSTPQLPLRTFPEKKIDWQAVARFLTNFDQENALKRLSNNYDLYGKMLADFYRNLEKEIGDWGGFTGIIDRARLRVSAHNIKSMAAYVGAEKLREISLKTENACEDGAGDLDDRLREFMSLCETTLQELQNAHQTSLNEPDNTAALKDLYSAVQFHDCDLSLKALGRFQPGQKTWPAKTLAAIRQDIHEFKFTEVAQLLEDNGITEGAPLPADNLPTLLIVDDSPEAIDILYNLFSDECHFCAATSGQMALNWLEKFCADLIMLDVVMPQMNGIKAYKKIRETPHAQNTPIIFISGVSEIDVEREVLNLGAADYILKPYNVATVQAKVHNQLALKKQHDQLANTVKKQRDALTQTQEAIIHGMAHLAEYRESYTGQHLRRIKCYTGMLAEEIHKAHPDLLTEMDVHYITALSPVHDIGKVGIRDNILKKMGPLTIEEFEEMKRHTVYGADVIQRTRDDLGISNFVMDMARQIVTNHHEHYDGSGYPYGLKGEEIPLAARIVALADVYDALTSERPYKSALPHAEAVHIITHGDGRTSPEHFDPKVLEAFTAVAEDFHRVASRR